MQARALVHLAACFLSLLCCTSSAHAGYSSITEPRRPSSGDSTATPAHEHPDNGTVSWGFGLGASFLGVEYENLFSRRVGFQLGTGFLGADAGLTVHFAPGKRTHHLFLGYMHFGVEGDSFAGGAMGASLVFRDRGWLTMQLGVAHFIVDGGPRSTIQAGDDMLLMALGVCPRSRWD